MLGTRAPYRRSSGRPAGWPPSLFSEAERGLPLRDSKADSCPSRTSVSQGLGSELLDHSKAPAAPFFNPFPRKKFTGAKKMIHRCSGQQKESGATSVRVAPL